MCVFCCVEDGMGGCWLSRGSGDVSMGQVWCVVCCAVCCVLIGTVHAPLPSLCVVVVCCVWCVVVLWLGVVWCGVVVVCCAVVCGSCACVRGGGVRAAAERGTRHTA